MNKYSSSIILLSIVIFPSLLINAQNHHNFSRFPLNVKTVSNNIESRSFVATRGLSRFVSGLDLQGARNYSSHRVALFIDGDLSNYSFLGLRSPDLLLIENSQIDSIFIDESPSIYNGVFCPGGAVRIFEKHYIDSAYITLNADVGSETGDPLIHNFTGGTLETGNKNKFVPSFNATFSFETLGYESKLNGGYRGYFEAGSVNDQSLIALSDYYFKKQNKIGFVSLETERMINEDNFVKLFFGVKSFYGWVFSPFLLSTIHGETASLDFLLRFMNFPSSFNAGYRLQTQFNEINQTGHIIRSKFSKVKNSFEIDYSLANDKFEASFFAEASFMSIGNFNRAELSHYDFFEKEATFGAGKFCAKLSYYDSPTSKASVTGAIEKSYSEYAAAGVQFDYLKFISETGVIKFKLSLIPGTPTEEELFGSYEHSRKISLTEHETYIYGNRDLKNERNIYIGLIYEKSLNIFPINFSINPYFHKIDNPIKLIIHESFLLNGFAASGKYGNGRAEELIGANGKISVNLSENLSSSIDYKYKHNYYSSRFPKNCVRAQIQYKILFGSTLILEYAYRGKSYFEEFQVDKNNDYDEGKGIDGSIPEFNSLNAVFSQRIENFFFKNSMDITFELQNIANKKNRFIPVGNYIERAASFYLAFYF